MLVIWFFNSTLYRHPGYQDYVLETLTERERTGVDVSTFKRINSRSNGFLNIQPFSKVDLMFDMYSMLFWSFFFFGGLTNIFYFIAMSNSRMFGYDTIVVGTECNSDLSVSDTVGRNCVWYETNQGSCGLYDRPDSTETQTSTSWNSDTSSYETSYTTVDVPGFTASDLCCACGRPWTDVTEEKYNPTKS